MKAKLANLLDLIEYVGKGEFYHRYVEPFSCWLDPENAIMHFTFSQAISNVRHELPYCSRFEKGKP